jgi:hypothetical protein
MGIIRLSSKYRRWMRDESFLEPLLYELDTPEKMLEYYEDFFHKRRIRMVQKDCTKSKYSRVTTSRNNELQLDCEFPNFSVRKKATLFAHEAVHYRQRDRFGPTKFELQYVADARFRVAMEGSAFRESMSAHRALGASDEWCRKYAERIPSHMKRIYFIPTLDYGNVKKHVISSMLEELEHPWREPKKKPPLVRGIIVKNKG